MTVGELLVLLAEYDPDCEVMVQGDGQATGIDWYVRWPAELGNAIIINDYPVK